MKVVYQLLRSGRHKCGFSKCKKVKYPKLFQFVRYELMTEEKCLN